MEDGKLPIQTGIKGVSAFALLTSPKIFKYLSLKRKIDVGISIIDPTLCCKIDGECKLDKTGIKKEASKCIKEFESTLKNEGLYLGNLYENIGSYCVEMLENKNLRTQKPGYDSKSKKIRVVEGKVRSTIFRSLLTCASTYEPLESFDYLREATGFHQVKYEKNPNGKLKKVYEIGEGLNVAYTEMLLERYFKCRGAEPEEYDLLKNLALIIEMIVGRKYMANLYLKRDLGSLVDSLPNRYIGGRIIRIMDFIYSSVYQNNGSIAREKAGDYYLESLIELSKMFTIRIRGRNLTDSHSRIKLYSDVDLLNSILSREYVVRGTRGKVIDLPTEEMSEINGIINNTINEKRHCFVPRGIRETWYN